jgi:hypothetical protein
MNEHFFIGEKENSVYKIVRDEAEMIVALTEFEQELNERCELPHRSTDTE